MAGIFQGDIIIKTAIELGFEDMRKNPWLISHMLSDLARSPYLKDKYGKKQIDACKEWLANNQVDVYMRPREDRDKLPCISIEMGPSNEKPEMKYMSDLTPDETILYPNKIGEPIPYVIKPFAPLNYDPASGLISTPPSVDLSLIAAGMILVNPEDGTGYIISGIQSTGLSIEAGQNIVATQFGVVPQYQYYKARLEHAFFEESYNIRCHAHGDMQVLLWMWSIAKYAILRYKQSLLEANGFAETVLTSGSPDLDMEWTTNGGEKAFTRSLTITGQVEDTWIMAPHRIIENVSLKQPDSTAPLGYIGGIKILSNLDSPAFIDQSNENWITVEDSEDE